MSNELEKAVEELIGILKGQNEILKGFIALGEKEKEILTHNRWEELIEITSFENKLSADLARMEEKRKEIYSFLKKELNLSDSSSSLQDFLEVTEIPYKGELTLLRSLLKINIEKLKELNELNFFLLQKSLSYFKKMENGLLTNNNYDNEGLREKKPEPFFFNKTV